MGQLKEIDCFLRADLEPGALEDLGSGRVRIKSNGLIVNLADLFQTGEFVNFQSIKERVEQVSGCQLKTSDTIFVLPDALDRAFPGFLKGKAHVPKGGTVSGWIIPQKAPGLEK